MGALREYHEEIDSTQRRAVELARAGAPEGARVVAAQQTGGIGRAGHRWWSPPGGLYVSVIVEFADRPPPLLPLAIGGQLAEALERRFGLAPRLKWPNDVLVLGPGGAPRKLAGVLVDALPSQAGRTVAVAGVGVNVRTPEGGFPPEIEPAPVALSDLTATAPELREVEELTVGAVVGSARELRREGGPRRVVARCRERLFGIGRSAWVDGVRIGTIRSLAPDGALQVDRAGGPMTIRVGDLRVGDP
jgi:BirA family transcriptional regulator, biotin operon repressor / biotin---[acetyl-CoA-carboxylase] ligase